MNSVLEFYELLYRIVRGWPVYESGGKILKCKQLQTFATLREEAELSSGTLEKDIRYKDKKYFYSREWEYKNFRPSELSFDFPALILFQNNFDLKASVGCSEKDVEWKLCVLDEAPMKIESGTVDLSNYCQARTWEEIEADTQELIEVAMSAILDSIKAEITPLSGPAYEIWAPRTGLDQAVTNGDITSYTELDELCNWIHEDEEDPLQGVTINAPYGLGDRIGSFLDFKMRFRKEYSTVISPIITEQSRLPD